MEAGLPKFGAHLRRFGIMEGQEASDVWRHVFFQVEFFQPGFKLCGHPAGSIGFFYRQVSFDQINERVIGNVLGIGIGMSFDPADFL